MERTSCPSRPLKRFAVLALGLALSPGPAFASYKVGGTIGFGGTGIVSDVDIQSTTVTVRRSDSPGVGAFFFEYDLSSDWSVAFTHTRGFALSPFSSGVAFTGVSWKWFYADPAPSFVGSPAGKSTLLLTQLSPYVGPEIGHASGVIHRQNDLVEEINASAVFFGLRAGVDYQSRPNWVTRIEFSSAMTPPSSGFVKSSLSEFAISYGLHFIFE